MADEELIHYGEFRIELDRDRTYDQTKGPTGKPVGLWVSVRGEYDWEWWCRDNEFHLSGLNHAHRVTLRADANVLWIRTARELDAFHLVWSHETDFERRMAQRRDGPMDQFVQENGLTFTRNQWPIDWEKVAQRWAGIIITPYLWSRRFGGPFWYYGVDAASGCIWNLSAIDRFEHVQELNTHEEKEKSDVQDR